jgi:hypothetical protein
MDVETDMARLDKEMSRLQKAFVSKIKDGN